MPIATKNNQIIVKDGSVAADCGCCGGWNCYQDCDSNVCGPCGYSKNMPGTLNVSISLSISTTIYAAELGGNAFGGPLKYWPVRIESADFSSASLSYLISSNEFPCSYSGISRPDVLRHSVVTKLDGNGNLFEGIAWDGGICGDWQDGQFLES
jgi:hypothetical protein